MTIKFLNSRGSSRLNPFIVLVIRILQNGLHIFKQIVKSDFGGKIRKKINDILKSLCHSIFKKIMVVAYTNLLYEKRKIATKSLTDF